VTSPKDQPKDAKPRCWWCGEDPLYVRYHDTEWGVPVHEDRRIFEFLVLESFQAGGRTFGLPLPILIPSELHALGVKNGRRCYKIKELSEIDSRLRRRSEMPKHF
jgi:hypothetical protein